MVLSLTITLIIAVVATAVATSDSKPRARLISIGTAAVYPPTPDRPTCQGSNRAIGFYRQAVRETLGRIGPVELPARRWWGCNSARRRAVEWRAKAHEARVALAKWIAYQYDWRTWLPRNWYLVGSCESGYGGDPNWEHSNSRFTSAFGISWQEYDADAAYMGAPPWNVRHTPRDQYKAALGHYARFGDGWDCPGP